MGLFSSKGSGPSIITKEVWFPHKRAVSTPMSQFLSSQVGKGLPSYKEATGKDLTTARSREGLNNMTEFLKTDPTEWFDKAVAAPAMKEFKENLLPEIREGYAGSLRGSGRYRAEEAGINEFADDLATKRYQATMDITQKQFAMETQYIDQMDRQRANEYTAWMKTLPQNNPVLETAIKYLQESTETGKKILSAVDPGTQGGSKGILGAAGMALGMGAGLLLAPVTAGMSIPASMAIMGGSAAIGGAIGGAAGSAGDAMLS